MSEPNEADVAADDQATDTDTATPDAPGGGIAAPERWWRVGGAGRVDVRKVVAAHERFVRDTAAMLSRITRCQVEVPVVSAEWLSVGEYLACLDGPVVIGQLELPGAAGGVLLGLEAPIGLHIVDRLLGGSGATAPRRPPTELELDLLGDVLSGPVAAVGEVFGPLLTGAPQITELITQLELLRTGPRTEPAMVTTYRIELALPVPVSGLLTLCYPVEVVRLLLSVVGQPQAGDEPNAAVAGDPALRQLVEHVEMDLVASLQPSSVPAEDLRRLQVGDVLILDHHRDHPIDLSVGGTVVFDGALGRRGRAVAVQVRQQRATPDALIKELSQ